MTHVKMAEHLHIDYPIGGASACNKLLEEIDWDKFVDDFSTIEMVKTIGLITIMYDFPELMCEIGVVGCPVGWVSSGPGRISGVLTSS